MPTISDLLDAGIPGTLLPDAEAAQATSRWSIPCHDGDPELWFADTPAGVEHAKALCGGCPLKVECLAGALDRAEPWGVWGGELFEHGVVVPRKRPRGRPRKSDVA
ncbi:MAG TPA: WhiB family transcriptional regulator [Actinomycetes bacterium]|nr:WhiB family transcriptional regulator [Actinomycetes bacterium]